MKKLTCLFLSILFIFSFSTLAFAEKSNADFTASGKIVISLSANETEKFASSKLCEKLNLIFGGYSIASSNTAESGDIIIGNNTYINFDFSSKKLGSFYIKSVDNKIIINGNGTDGLINGVYEFLDRFCNYEVYEKDIIRYTDAEKLVINEKADVEYEPFFEYRKVDTASSYNNEYAHANSLNSNIKFPDSQGGMVEYISQFAHTLTTQFCSADKYFNEHPEYFALHDGKRTPDQICPSNEDTVKLITDEVLQLLKERHDPTQNLQIVSLTQNDNGSNCTCEKCKALDEANGSNIGSMLTMVNKVAQKVKQAGYDNVAVDTFAYQWTRTVPTKIKPLDNVIIRLCSIECCFAHPINYTKCKQNKLFMDDLKGWGKICDRVYIWDYVNNYSETFLPFPNFNVLQENIKTFYENGAKGLYEEGNYYMNECNGEFYELRSYLLSKLMENPFRTDYSELMNNYLEAVYGPGGKYLREYIDLTCSLSDNHLKIDDKRMQIRQQPLDCLPGITFFQIKKIDKLWKQAKEEAENEEQLSRIERSELSWLYWKCCRLKGEYTIFQSPFKYMQSHVELLKKIEKFGNTAVGEGVIKQLRRNPARVLFFTPTKWQSKYDGKFFDKLDNFAKWFYELSGEKYDFEY